MGGVLVLAEYLQQMMPSAQAARILAHYDNTLSILARIPCATDIRSHLVECVDFVARDSQSVHHSQRPISVARPSLSSAESRRSRVVPGYKSVHPAVSGSTDEPKSQTLTESRSESKGRHVCQTYNEVSGNPQAEARDPWTSCNDFDPARSRCKSPAGYCRSTAVPHSTNTPIEGNQSTEASVYIRKIDLIRRLSDLASEASYEPSPDHVNLPFIRQAHLSGSDSELWRKAAFEWHMKGRLSEQVLMMSALAMRPSIHHRETITLLDDVWTLRGYYDDMGVGEVSDNTSENLDAENPVDLHAISEIDCVWRRRTLANGIAIGFWNRLRTASMNLECGSRRDVIRIVNMDDWTAVRFLSLDTCVPFLIRPEMACRDMADSALSQVLGGTGDVVDDIWSGEWANGLLVVLGSSILRCGKEWMGSVLADIDVRYMECLTRRRYAPLAQMALCVPVWQALNGRHMLIERAALQEASPDWSWPEEMAKIAVSEIKDVAGGGSFKRAQEYAQELLDDETFMQLAEDPVCHALLDAERYDKYLIIRLLGYIFARCECATGRECRLHASRSLMCSDAAGAYALICSRLGLGKALMALNSWLSAVIFLKRRSTFRAMAYGVHAGKQARTPLR
jgi:hypothetical protein